jgi:hypothetical protein
MCEQKNRESATRNHSNDKKERERERNHTSERGKVGEYNHEAAGKKKKKKRKKINRWREEKEREREEGIPCWGLDSMRREWALWLCYTMRASEGAGEWPRHPVIIESTQKRHMNHGI